MIKIFNDGDAKRCSEIMLKCVDKFEGYSKENKDFLIKMSQPDKLIEKARKTMFYVYQENGKILGTGVFDNGEIRTMFVDPEYQGKGIGERILKFLVNLGKSKGYKRFFLGANPEAEGFYEKMGFIKTGETNDFNFRTINMERVF